jgi:proteic killer suppression protein
MIKSFKDGALRRFWKDGKVKGIDPKSVPRIKRILSALDAATKPEDLALPGYGFHELKGNRRGQYAVEVRAQWRIVFEWSKGHAVRVRLEDYHGRK